MEIATRSRPRLRVVWDLRELTHEQNPGHEAFPPDLVQLRSTLPVGALARNKKDYLSISGLSLKLENFSPRLIPCCCTLRLFRGGGVGVRQAAVMPPLSGRLELGIQYVGMAVHCLPSFLLYNVVSLSRSFVTTELENISLG